MYKPLTPPLDNYDKPIPVLDLDSLIANLQSLRNIIGNVPVAIASQYSEDEQIASIDLTSDYVRIVPANFEE